MLQYVLINRKQMGAVLAGLREVHLHRDSDGHKRDPENHKRAYDEHNSI
jgi:hypothetical protein